MDGVHGLQRSLKDRRLPTAGGVVVDSLLAVLLTIEGIVELRSSDQPAWHGVTPAVLLTFQTLPVAFRRIRPASAMIVCSLATAIEAIGFAPTNTLAELLAALLIVYSVGRQLTGPTLVTVSAFAAVCLAIHIALLPDSGPADLTFAAVFASAAWLAGRSMRHRELERERAEAAAAAERQEAEARRVAAVADERSRIAREMHDIVAHGMGVMVVQAAAAEQLLELDPESAREPLATVRQTGQAAIAEMGRLLGLLNTGEDVRTGPQPRLAELPTLVERLGRAGMPVTLAVSGELDELSDGLQLCIYRIVQEALTNALKHAGRVETAVAIDHRDHVVVVRIRNQAGAHPPATTVSTGHGLVGMRERVALYGGELAVGPQADGSFAVVAALPTVG